MASGFTTGSPDKTTGFLGSEQRGLVLSSRDSTVRPELLAYQCMQYLVSGPIVSPNVAVRGFAQRQVRSCHTLSIAKTLLLKGK